MEEDELLDLVNAKDEVIGTVMREEHHANTDQYSSQGKYWRGTACLLVNSEGKFWIPQRQPDRRIRPNALDFSMAEHVQSGESHMAGALRGMEEELHLQLKEEDLELVGIKPFKEFGCMMSLYLHRTDEDPDYSKKDYQRAWWLSADEIRDKIKSGMDYKDALPIWLDEVEKLI